MKLTCIVTVAILSWIKLLTLIHIGAKMNHPLAIGKLLHSDESHQLSWFWQSDKTSSSAILFCWMYWRSTSFQGVTWSVAWSCPFFRWRAESVVASSRVAIKSLQDMIEVANMVFSDGAGVARLACPEEVFIGYKMRPVFSLCFLRCMDVGGDVSAPYSK